MNLDVKWNTELTNSENVKYFLNRISISFFKEELFYYITLVNDGLDDVYYGNSHDVRIELLNKEVNLIHRIKARAGLGSTISEIENSINRLFVELNSEERIIIFRKSDENNFLISNETIDLKKHNLEPIEKYKTNSKHISNIQRISLLDIYKQHGLFDLLEKDVIDKGYQLAYEYGVNENQEMLWKFNELIFTFSMEERENWEAAVAGFINNTKGHLVYDNFSKIDCENEIDVDISLKINGEQFIAYNLTDNFTFRFIKLLNSFLLEKYGTLYLVFNWDNNAHEQLCFIYTKKEIAENLVSKFREFIYLEDEAINFFEEIYC